MDYMIVNLRRSLYIKLDNGRPVTCSKNDMQRFEYSKARNILDNLPKNLQRLHFRVEPIPEISKPTKAIVKKKDPKRTIKKEYIVPTEIQTWLDKVKECNGLAVDAATRKEELIHSLSNVDKELCNCLHEIELESNKSASEGYKEYRRAKIILEQRRVIKDELSVVDSILSCNLQSMATDRIQKVVDGLGKRSYVIRDVELGDIYSGAEVD